MMEQLSLKRQYSLYNFSKGNALYKSKLETSPLETMEMWITQSKPTGKYWVVLDTLQIIPFLSSPAESFSYKTPNGQ